MLDKMPPARLFDETLKMMLGGHATASLEWLIRLELLEHLFPDVAHALEHAPESASARVLQLGLEGTDERVRDDRSVTPMFLFAVLLWPAVLHEIGAPDGPLPEDPQRLLDAIDRVTGRQMRRIAVPKRFSLPMRELMMLQTRFERRSGRRALRLLEHPRFRAAYDFLLLRAEAGEAERELADWWTQLQEASPADRVAMVENRAPPQPGAAPVEQAGGEPARRRRRRPRRRKPAAPPSGS
jgi:poly(A) polymerase